MMVYTRCHDSQQALIRIADKVRRGVLTRQEAFAEAKTLAAARDGHRTKGVGVHVSPKTQGIDLTYMWRKQA